MTLHVSLREQFAEVPDLAEPFSLDPAAKVRAARARRPLYPVLKRLLDLGVALPLLILTAPLLIATALWIRLDSKGPATFRQARLGMGGKPFHILKFRTMSVIEDGENVVQAERNDARITRAGRFLRAASIDELPQLLNVITGEMSLVGPRPHAIAHDVLYARLIPEYVERQAVKPGITGWAQVHGHRGGTPTVEAMRARVAHDLWYAGHASLLIDIWVLLRTPLELIRSRNAY